MNLNQDIHLLQILKEEAKIELPVKFNEKWYAMLEASNNSMTIYNEGDLTNEQAKYIAHLLNTSPALLAEIERLRRENKSYRNYIASAPDHGVVDHE